ncbi:MAG: CPBP family glutamic-type intramembrane protease [Nanoarchaeota archaeon]|mgnify:CR=1 FL=1
MITGIDKNIFQDLIIGIVSAIAFIFASLIFPTLSSIGIPYFPQSIASEAGRWIIVLISAPIFETILFQEFILDFFDEKIGNFPYIIASIISSIAFALFHFSVYGENLSAVGGSFISAFSVGFAFCYLRKYTKSILPVIIAHLILNFYILLKLTVIIT